MPRNAWGGQLWAGLAGASVAQITHVKSLGGIDITYSMSNVTNLESANRMKEFIRGIGDGGEIPAVLIFEEADLSTVLGWLTQTPDKFPMSIEVRLPLISTQATRAKVAFSSPGTTKIQLPEFDVDSDDPIQLHLAFKVTGLPAFTAGS